MFSECIFIKFGTVSCLVSRQCSHFFIFKRTLKNTRKYWNKVEQYRSSSLQMFFKVGVLENFTNFPGKHLCWSPFLIKLQVCNFIKKSLQHRYFPVKFVKFLRTPFLQNTSRGCLWQEHAIGYGKSIEPWKLLKKNLFNSFCLEHFRKLY